LIQLTQALANQVCEKVESKVRTTYNEVADELVSEFGNVEGTGQHLLLLRDAIMCIITTPPAVVCR
jgi:CheY-specific phosphatase CheX